MTGTITQLIEPRSRDLGGFEVRRVLPAAGQRMVGPFIFFDHMGPSDLPPGKGIDVRPHPHIGLATVTYLFEGEILHRDSLGFEQPIRPGEVNWMTAGSGIVHSERSGSEARAQQSRLHGIQSWIALPKAKEETAPSFRHYAIEDLPNFEIVGVACRLIAGSAYGRTSPVETFSPMFYLDVRFPASASLTLPVEYEERAVYVAEGAITLNGEEIGAGRMAVLAANDEVRAEAAGPARAMLLGGVPIDGDRHIWWNFVSSSKERIERAKADWKDGRFDAVPGETEFIPLPED